MHERSSGDSRSSFEAAAPETHRLRVTFPRQVFVIVFLCVTVGLGVRSALNRDSRLGWGMFSRNMAYEIHYAWVFPDQSRVAYLPGDELQGTARERLGPRRPPRDGYANLRNTRYGLGTMRAWIQSYLGLLAREYLPPGAIAVEAILRYHINVVPSRPDKPPLETLTIRYPESGGAESEDAAVP